MAYVVCEPCRDCKYTDCVVVCPMDCFYQDETMLYIDPHDCIDCEACVPECPVEAIFHDAMCPHRGHISSPSMRSGAALKEGGNITEKQEPKSRGRAACGRPMKASQGRRSFSRNALCSGEAKPCCNTSSTRSVSCPQHRVRVHPEAAEELGTEYAVGARLLRCETVVVREPDDVLFLNDKNDVLAHASPFIVAPLGVQIAIGVGHGHFRDQFGEGRLENPLHRRAFGHRTPARPTNKRPGGLRCILPEWW